MTAPYSLYPIPNSSHYLSETNRSFQCPNPTSIKLKDHKISLKREHSDKLMSQFCNPSGKLLKLPMINSRVEKLATEGPSNLKFSSRKEVIPFTSIK